MIQLQQSRCKVSTLALAPFSPFFLSSYYVLIFALYSLSMLS